MQQRDVVMRRFLFFISLNLFIFCFHAEAQPTANITYFDSSGAEKKATWKTRTFIIEKSHEGFVYKKAQTWVALPPLLELKSNNSKFKTLPNSDKEGSPFSADTNIKTVLRFEHFDSNIVFPMRKKTINGESTVRIKIDGLLETPIVSISEACKKQGLQLNSSNKAKSFISVDCKIVDSGLQVGLWSSENLASLPPSHPDIQVEVARPRFVILSIGHQDLTSSEPLEVFQIKSDNNPSLHSVIYNKPNPTYVSAPTNHKKKRLAGVLQTAPSLETDVDHPSVTLANAAIYGSKLGAEALLSVDYKPHHTSGFLTFYALAPFRYFQESIPDTFFELAASFNHRLGLSTHLPLTLGLGFKGIKLNDLNTKHVTLTGPELILRLIDLDLFPGDIHYSMSARYTPTFLRPDYKGQRLLWEFASFRLYQSPEFDISLSSQYSFLQIKTENFRYTDSKFMGGASLQW